MSTSTLDRFLAELAPILQAKDGAKLRDYLIIEPPLPALYHAIVSELRQSYPANRQDQLDKHCEAALPEYEGEDVGGSWPAFQAFLLQYFAFLRDVDAGQLLETHEACKSLLNQCILALSDSVMGIVVLPTVISYSRILARLSIGLDKHPELVASLARRSALSGEEAGERITLVETSANIIREAFKKCLSERAAAANGGLDASGVPTGRRIGIYVCANLCLKLFFHCRKLRSAEQIFSNIYQQSPPLARFPAGQRVPFLYYLGRYHFANSHFGRARAALQAAYDQCHARCPRQRALVLVYLVAANVILGRFPGAALLGRPEARALAPHFAPLCTAIRRGDLASFRALVALDSPSGSFFLRRRVLLQLRNRAEVLVWRSLARRTFLLVGFHGDESKRAPTLDIDDLRAAVAFLEGKAADAAAAATAYVDPDLAGTEDRGPGTTARATISFEEVEAGVASLVAQGLLRGYVSHRQGKLAILGARGRSALDVGFPSLPSVLRRRPDEEVPGWVRDDAAGVAAATGTRAAGKVVRLTGARPAGAAPA